MRKKQYLVVSTVAIVTFLAMLVVMAMSFQGCAVTKTLDWRTLDTPAKRYHFAQKSFEQTQLDYIDMFGKQTVPMKTYLREKVSPVLNRSKLALDAWGEVVLHGVPNTGQEGAFTRLVDDLAILLKPYIVKEE